MGEPSNTITYGAFTLPLARLSVTSATEYASDQATVIGTAYEFSVSGWISVADQATMAQTIVNMKSVLNTPQLGLIVAWGGDSSGANFYNFGKADDITWGPRPGTLTINQFLGGRAIAYSWSVAVVVKECATIGGGGTCSPFSRPNEVLAFTQNFDFQVDANGFTTRTINGRLVITSAAVRQGVTADNYRYLVTPNNPKFYQRTSHNFQTSEDRLTLTYSVTDREVVATFPRPMTDGGATWNVSVEEMGTIANYTLSGSFTAPPQISKATIVQAITDLIASRFSPIPNVIFTSNSLEDDIYNNRISFTVHGYSVVSPGGPSLSAAFSTVGAPPPNSDGVAYLPGPYGGDIINGNSGVIAFPLALYDSCTSSLSIFGRFTNQNGQKNGTQPTPDPNGSDGINPVAYQDSPGGSLSQENQAAPFIEHVEHIEYRIANHIRQFNPKSPSTGGPNPGYTPVFQQTAAPTMAIIQAGYTIRDVPNGSSIIPSAPAPTMSDNVVVAWAHVSPATPISVGLSGATRWRLDWCYVLRYKKSISASSDLALTVPADPRTTNYSADNPPQLPAIPDSIVRVL